MEVFCISPSAAHIVRNVALCDAGLVLGGETCLSPFSKDTNRLMVDPARLTGLLSIAFGRPPSYRNLSAIAAAETDWRLGDKALANLRLVFSGLPRLDAPDDVYRLKAAEILFDAGVTAEDLAKIFGFDPDANDVSKGYNAAQPRVPAGSGPSSGQWTDGLWARFSAWLNEKVPEYDQDTGLQVGTRSRARAIALNPLTVGLAAAATLLGGETAAGAGAVIVGAADVAEDTLATNAVRGLASQKRVLEELGLAKNTKAVATSEGRSVPDALTDTISLEIKDANHVSRTAQVRIQTEAARSAGRESILVTGEKTRISLPAQRAFTTIVRRKDLGPR